MKSTRKELGQYDLRYDGENSHPLPDEEEAEEEQGGRVLHPLTGAPITIVLHDKGLTTDRDWQNKDGDGNEISSRFRRTSLWVPDDEETDAS